MSSLLNARGLYLLLMRTPILYLYSATLVFVASIVSGWWFFLYLPSARSIENLYLTLGNMHQKTLMVKKTEHELAALTRSIAELKMNMASFGVHQPRKNVIPQMLALLADTALHKGMSVYLCRVSEQNVAAGCTQILFSGKGTLDQLIVFFETLKNNKKILDCSSCEMARTDCGGYALKVVFNIVHV